LVGIDLDTTFDLALTFLAGLDFKTRFFADFVFVATLFTGLVLEIFFLTSFGFAARPFDFFTVFPLDFNLIAITHILT